MFSSYFWAGFECTSALNEYNYRLNLISTTKHDVYCARDYELIKKKGITTVREGLSWNAIDKGQGEYDFALYEDIMNIGKVMNIQQIWDLNHFDYPQYLDPFSEKFISQFTEYARRCIQLIRKYQKGTIYIVPINEISFFSWIGADIGNWAPFTKGKNNGFIFKTQLVRAAIAAMEAIKKEDNDVKFIHIDPFMRRKAKDPIGKSAQKHTDEFNNIIRFEAWDLLSGKKMPELGGSQKYMDLIGVNYYFHNQEWVISPQKRGGHLKHQAMDWSSKHRISFAEMLGEIYQRYKCPLVISETGSYGKKREKWWERVLTETDEALKIGIPVQGICAYPILDRPSWEHFLLPQSGLWDFKKGDKNCRRIPYTPALNLIEKYIHNR